MQQPILKALIFLFPLLWLAACASLPDEEPEPRVVIPMDRPHQGILSVLSLNLAHGRKDSVNQLFLRKEDFENNLSEIADLIIETDADIVALQEADGPSRWSGGFDHVATLAEDADYPWFERASHAQSWMFDYGTALLTRQPFEEVLNHTFESSPPTMDKGMILGQIAWQKEQGSEKSLLVDIVSVHLDFSRKSVREKQIEELGNALEGRKNPVIILGDFNSEWFSDASIVQALAERAKLQVYMPEATNLGTYKDGKKRLDWILISQELEFIKYSVLPINVSDHFPVYAEIAIR